MVGDKIHQRPRIGYCIPTTAVATSRIGRSACRAYPPTVIMIRVMDHPPKRLDGFGLGRMRTCRPRSGWRTATLGLQRVQHTMELSYSSQWSGGMIL